MLVIEKNGLDTTHNRADKSGDSGASPTAMFEKGLRAFEIGDLSFSDLQSNLARLLNDGARPHELLKVLRRRDSIEPLPEQERDRLVAVLREAMQSGVAEGSMSAEHLALPAVSDAMPSSATDEADSAAMARLIQEFQTPWGNEPEARPAPSPVAPPDVSVANVDYKVLRLALDQREEDLAALQTEHARVLGLLEARARSSAQLQYDMRELSGQLEAASGLLRSQQNKTREIEEVLAERIAAEEAARTRSEQARGEEAARHTETHRKELHALRQSLTERDETIARMSQALAAREAQLTALQNERAATDSRAIDAAAAAAERNTAADNILALQRSLDERDQLLEAQKQQYSKVAAAFMARIKETETELKAARSRVESLTADAEHAAAAEVAEAAVKDEPDLEKTLPLLPLSAPPPLQSASPEFDALPGLELRRVVEVGDFSVPPPRPRAAPLARPNSKIPVAGICAVLAVLALIGWLALHHGPAVPKVAERAAAAPTPPAPGAVIRDCPTCPSFTVLSAGRFKQGSADNNASPALRPLHWVAIGHAFAMSTNTVTVDEFRAFATATGRDMQGCDAYDGKWKHQPKNSWDNPGFEQTGSHPVTCASWSDAEAYAQWLSSQTGHRYRLPSASEWEYAARAGSEMPQPWNSNGADACSDANVADLSAARHYPGWVAFSCNDGYVFTAPVGSFKANAFGLHDMLGNVFQWTEDCWNPTYKGAPIDGAARSDGNCTEHELRGGSWFSSPGYVRADYRNHFAANYRAGTTGIRLVRDITP